MAHAARSYITLGSHRDKLARAQLTAPAFTRARSPPRLRSQSGASRIATLSPAQLVPPEDPSLGIPLNGRLLGQLQRTRCFSRTGPPPRAVPVGVPRAGRAPRSSTVVECPAIGPVPGAARSAGLSHVGPQAGLDGIAVATPAAEESARVAPFLLIRVVHRRWSCTAGTLRRESGFRITRRSPC